LDAVSALLVALGFACTQTAVPGIIGTPALSGWDLMGGIVVLTGVAAFMLRRRASAAP